MTPVLSARSLTFTYGTATALRGVSVDVEPGELLAITGASGSGKSTLLLCLAGILRPQTGDVVFGTRLGDLAEAQRSKLRRGPFGVVFQFGQLVPELTAEENVALPLLLSRTSRREAFAAAHDLLGRFGVAEVAGKRPGQVSGGQQQRIALARAMVTSPRVLFADEPTGALDSLTSEAVLSEIVRIARDDETAVVLVTHDATVAAYADREVVMRDGQLDPPTETMRTDGAA